MTRHRTRWPTIVSVDIVTKDDHRFQLKKRVNFTEPPSTREIHPDLGDPVTSFKKSGATMFRAQIAPQRCGSLDEALAIADSFRQLGFTT